MEPSKEAIAVRLARLNRLILGKGPGANPNNNLRKKIDREALLDALTVLYDECNDDPVKKGDELVRVFVDKYRSTLAELRRTRVCLADFNSIQLIGRGHFGEVHMVREKETCDVYALKTLRKEVSSKRGAACVEEEREILASATTPWLPKLHYAFQDSSNLYLVMELCSGGDLAGLLSRRSSPLPERDAAFYVAEVAHGLKALHSMGYVHRDIKPQNILLDRCGHVKLGDFGSCARLTEGGAGAFPVGTADYVAPELLAVADCANRHAACLDCAKKVGNYSLSACDYWSLGVVAFELVTLRRPFSSGDEDSVAQTLSNIQRYEREPNSVPPFDPPPQGPSEAWRSLVAGLLQVPPSKRYHYLDTLQHPALQHLSTITIREQVPPWVPYIRGCEDCSNFPPLPRLPPPPCAAPFRTRAPFHGQLPYVGFSYVAPDDSEDTISSFNSSSHDCTAIDLATFKSAEKLAIARAKEIGNLQGKLSACETTLRELHEQHERARRCLEARDESTRARLQADITALALQNKRLERQIEIEKEERMVLERSNQESVSFRERNSNELRNANARVTELECEREVMREQLRRLEGQVSELRSECERARAAADEAHAQQMHFKESMAKERAIRRQTITDISLESRETAARIAAAAASVAKETRAREAVEQQLTLAETNNLSLQSELDDVKRQLARFKECSNDSRRVAQSSSEELRQVQMQLTQERVRASTLLVQVQELQKSIDEANNREAALEEQSSRTEARLQQRVLAAESKASEALLEDARHREKVKSLEQLVRQLEREVNALERRNDRTSKKETGSDTESVGENETAAGAQISLLKEQLERAEAQLQARAEEIATLKQEIRTANLARWRKEREYNELQVESKSSTREVKRLEERVQLASEARKAAESKLSSLQAELADIRPKYESEHRELDQLKERFHAVVGKQDALQAEVDRSRNDILKLKSELQYSEKRRIRAEKQEELASQERAHLRDENHELRATAQQLEVNNKALQEACSLLEDQLNDLEKLADLNEIKNKDLEKELNRVREELTSCRNRLNETERAASESNAVAARTARHAQEVEQTVHQTREDLLLLTERIENRESRVAELEAELSNVESERMSLAAAAGATARRLRDLQEECSALRTRANQHHQHALHLQAQLHDAQEELSAAREAAEGAAAWWRTRETKADATLRQQAKLIDFLQAKVEEVNRKKCSLSNKLFGRSGRRNSNASPPLRRANKELRDEVERLRAKLATGSDSVPATPRKDKHTSKPTDTPKLTNGNMKSIDIPDGLKTPSKGQGYNVDIVWSEKKREQVHARCVDGSLVFQYGGQKMVGRVMSSTADRLVPNESSRAFTVVMEEGPAIGSRCAVICPSGSCRGELLRAVGPPSRYHAHCALCTHTRPLATLHHAPHVIAIGTEEGLSSLQGSITLELDSTPLAPGPLRRLASANNRALFLYKQSVLQAALPTLESALKRAANLNPVVQVTKVKLPDTSTPHLIQSCTPENPNGPSLSIACGQRVFLLRYDAATSEFKISRSLTVGVDRAPNSLLLTPRTLYVAGDKPIKVTLPSGAIEQFAMEEPTVAVAAKKHSSPKALLQIKPNPLEILICYSELGVFVDERGRRTRSDDPKWTTEVHNFEFVSPFLYLIGRDYVKIIYINDDAYKSPPCTCDNHSVNSQSDSYAPEAFTMKLVEPALLGTAPNGIIVRTKTLDEYSVSIIEGLAAFRSIGASIESLETISDTKGSTTDLPSSSDVSNTEVPDVSVESVVPNTGFLADIRERARQLRLKNRNNPPSDDVIKEILTTEIGMKKRSVNRVPSPPTSEFSSDTESEPQKDDGKTPADLCAEMFTRQACHGV